MRGPVKGSVARWALSGERLNLSVSANTYSGPAGVTMCSPSMRRIVGYLAAVDRAEYPRKDEFVSRVGGGFEDGRRAGWSAGNGRNRDVSCGNTFVSFGIICCSFWDFARPQGGPSSSYETLGLQAGQSDLGPI